MISYLPKLQAKDLYIYIYTERERERERERARFCKCDAKWLEHSQRCSGCDSAKIFLTSKSRDAKKGSWKWASGATIMILICHALMQVSFRWVGTSFKDEHASKTWRRPSLGRANRTPCVDFWHGEIRWTGHSEPAANRTPSIGRPLLLGYGWTSTPSSQFIFGFTLVTNSLGDRSHI
jgi:hypothetical protein